MTIRRSLNKVKTQNLKVKTTIQNSKFLLLTCTFTFLVLPFWFYSFAQEANEEPIIVDGDKIEFSTDKKEVIVTGHAHVISKGTKLTCQKLTLNNQTKEVVAEGEPRLDEEQGVLEGEKIIYNFGTKTGTIINSGFRSNPYFGKALKTRKVSDKEIIAYRGYFTTCNYDNPHYRMKSGRINIFPGDKMKARDITFYIGALPVFYMPQYGRSLKDPIMHVQFMPGKSKQWGLYLLSAWRYRLTEDVTGRIYFDWREKLGVAEGFGLNYKTDGYGKGDFKYYYTQERNRNRKDFPKQQSTAPREFQRYLIRIRHKWDIGEQTMLVSEYWKIADSKVTLHPSKGYNLLKEFFYREYETGANPPTYVSIHHSFTYSTLDFLLQKRVNRWLGETEKLPEVKFNLPSFRLGESPVYFTHISQAVNLNVKKPVPSPSSEDKHVNRFDASNTFSLPVKLAFVKFNPAVTYQGTYYDKDIFGSSTLWRSFFAVGTDATTKFYRIFNVKSNFLGIDINNIRHIITPAITYGYSHEPTVPADRIIQIDGVDGLSGPGNSAALSLSNILQTKRKGGTVNFFDFLVTNTYSFKTKGAKSNLANFLYKIDFLPYSWMRLTADATLDHHKDYFTNVGYAVSFEWAKASFGFDQRYQRKGANELGYNLKWKLNPKWTFSVLNRWVTGHHYGGIKRGLREQQFFISRDMHCWITEVTYNVTRDKGEAMFINFRLKAFPELEFEYNKEYHRPKPGEQSY